MEENNLKKSWIQAKFNEDLMAFCIEVPELQNFKYLKYLTGRLK